MQIEKLVIFEIYFVTFDRTYLHKLRLADKRWFRRIHFRHYRQKKGVFGTGEICYTFVKFALRTVTTRKSEAAAIREILSGWRGEERRDGKEIEPEGTCITAYFVPDNACVGFLCGRNHSDRNHPDDSDRNDCEEEKAKEN
jgi:hypothetical protein